MLWKISWSFLSPVWLFLPTTMLVLLPAAARTGEVALVFLFTRHLPALQAQAQFGLSGSLAQGDGELVQELVVGVDEHASSFP